MSWGTYTLAPVLHTRRVGRRVSRRDRRTRRTLEGSGVRALMVVEAVCAFAWALTGWWLMVVAALVVGLLLLVVALRP